MPPTKRMLKEEFQNFFENPGMESLPVMLEYSTGEQSYLEFKEQWPTKGNLAKDILAFCNTQGGLIVIGIAENSDGTHSPSGMTGDFKDDADLKSELDAFLPEAAMNLIDLRNFDYSDWQSSSTISGKKFQIVFVEYDPGQTPVMSQSEKQGVSRNAIYIRRGASTREARFDDIQSLLEKRIEVGLRDTAITDLSQELEQLKTLYAQIPSHIRQGGLVEFGGIFSESMMRSYWGSKAPNPEYPAESFTKFVNSLIDAKKRAIERTLKVELYDEQ